MDPERGRSFHTGLSLGRLEISVAGCCVCQRPVSCPLPLYYKHTAIHQTCCHSSSLHPSSSDDPRAPFLFFLHLCVRSLIFSLPNSLLVPAVARDPGQSDRVVRFDACFGCGLSRREGQGGVGEGAGGGEEEGPQAHRDGETKSELGEVHKIKSTKKSNG